MNKKRYVLISVFDKTGVVDFVLVTENEEGKNTF